jgi:serine/threonine protein kinase
VALKIISSNSEHEDAEERFIREARLLAQLEHEHIVRLLDFGQQGTL